MIEISTSVSESLNNNLPQSESFSEELIEEDQVFFDSIRKDLDKIKKRPKKSTLDAIIKYSSSF
jgi:hypothetical protein